MDTGLLEKFKKKVEMESTYNKLLSRKAINTLINYFDVDIEEITYSNTISNPKELALSYYQEYFPEYYKIILDGIKTGKIKIGSDIEKSEVLEDGKCFIKLNNDDFDLIVIVHELGHYINNNITSKFVQKHRIFGEVVSFYFEKDFEEKNIGKYGNLFSARRSHRILSERKMIHAIKYMLEYEDYYLEHGNIDAIIDEKKIKLILKLSSYHCIGYGEYDTVNTLLKYPLANLISSYMIINDLEMKQNIDEYIIYNIDLFELMEDERIRKSILIDENLQKLA